jgi:hypothetical protein
MTPSYHDLVPDPDEAIIPVTASAAWQARVNHAFSF